MDMPELSVKRTLVKSPPELWSELSEAERLANHLGEFGQIRITKVEPEKTVAWEGEHGSGTVEIEASGWGTKVTLTAAVAETTAPGEVPVADTAETVAVAERAETEPSETGAELQAAEDVEPEAAEAPWLAEPAPPPPVERAPVRAAWEAPRRSLPTEIERRGLLSRLFGRRRRAPEPPRRPAWQPPQPPPASRRPMAVARPAPTPVAEPALDADRAMAVLEGALDKLGAAHHRPFSRG